jgi:ribonuclease P protein component
MTAPRHFPRSVRLLNAGGFDAVFKRGQRASGQYFSVVFAPGTGSGPRLGLTVSKKTAPRAVDRNRIKRQVRESFRLNQSQLPAVDMVISARPGSANAKRADLRAALEPLWTRIAKACAAS